MHPGDARIVRGAVVATALVAVVVVVVAGVLAGRTGVYGALLGSGLAIAFFAVTIVVVSVAGRITNELMLPAALATYLVKVIAIAAMLILLRDTTAFNRMAFALATVIGACVFLVAELRIALRTRTPYVEVEAGPGGRGGPRGDHGPGGQATVGGQGTAGDHPESEGGSRRRSQNPRRRCALVYSPAHGCVWQQREPGRARRLGRRLDDHWPPVVRCDRLGWHRLAGRPMAGDQAVPARRHPGRCRGSVLPHHPALRAGLTGDRTGVDELK
jgi:ATP synthase protein I